MEGEVLFQEQVGVVKTLLQACQGGLDPLKILGDGTAGRERGRLGLEERSSFDQVRDFLWIEEQSPSEGFLQVFRAVFADKRALSHTTFDNAHHGQRSECFPERRPAYTELLAQRPFRGQALTGRKLVPGDQVDELIDDVVAEGTSLDGLKWRNLGHLGPIKEND